MASSQRIRYQPDYATRPGEVLEAYLDAAGMTKAELAERCGRPMKTISEIIHGKAAITAETALQLERVLGRPASLWQNLEAAYRLHLAAKNERSALSTHVAWADAFPIKILVDRGLMEPPSDAADRVGKLLAFFGVGSVSGWRGSFGQLQVAYRRSPAFTAAPENIATWVRIGELEAQALECEPFDKARFKAALGEIRALTAHPFEHVREQLVARCAEAGVAVAFVPELPKTHLSGIARWLSKDKALIQLTLRYRTADHLWFSFFHEAAHVLLHSKKEIFIDEEGGDRSELEEEANRFASDHLLGPRPFAAFVAKGDFSRRAVQQFAATEGIAAGIVVGRLQHQRVIPFSHLNDLKERLTWA